MENNKKNSLFLLSIQEENNDAFFIKTIVRFTSQCEGDASFRRTRDQHAIISLQC